MDVSGQCVAGLLYNGISVAADQSDPINGKTQSIMQSPFIIIFLLCAPLAATSVIQSSLNDGIRKFLLAPIMSAIDHRAPERHSTCAQIKRPASLANKTTRAKRSVHYTRNCTNVHWYLHDVIFCWLLTFIFIWILHASNQNASWMQIAPIRFIWISHCWERSVFLWCCIAWSHSSICIHNRKRNNERWASWLLRHRTRAIFSKPAFQWAECRRARKQPRIMSQISIFFGTLYL